MGEILSIIHTRGYLLFIATKNAQVHVPGGGVITFTKGQEVKPGMLKKAELAAPGVTNRYVIEMSDNFIERQLRWCKIIEKDSSMVLLWTIIASMFVKHMPTDKKVGQWCVGKMNKVSNKINKDFPSSIVSVKNQFVSSSHNWDGPEYDIIMDLNNLEDITRAIEFNVMLELM